MAWMEEEIGVLPRRDDQDADGKEATWGVGRRFVSGQVDGSSRCLTQIFFAWLETKERAF